MKGGLESLLHELKVSLLWLFLDLKHGRPMTRHTTWLKPPWLFPSLLYPHHYIQHAALDSGRWWGIGLKVRCNAGLVDFVCTCVCVCIKCITNCMTSNLQYRSMTFSHSLSISHSKNGCTVGPILLCFQEHYIMEWVTSKCNILTPTQHRLFARATQ